MLTFFFILMAVVFGRLTLFAIRMAWSIGRIFVNLLLVPFLLIILAMRGLLAIAIPVLAIIGLVSLFQTRRT